MTVPNRTLLGTANVRGALLLGALIAAISVVAVVIALRIYTQLDNAAAVERALVLAQQQLDTLVLIQVDQEAALRGFIDSGVADRFLEDPASGSRRFVNALDEFDATTKSLGIAQLHSSVAEMRTLHETWEHDVAEPLRAHPHDRNALTRQTLGKILIDQLRADTSRVHRLLELRLEFAQNDLKRRINEALAGGLASVLVFGFIAVAFLRARTQMLAVLARERSIVDTLQIAFRTDLDRLPGSRIGTAYISADLDAAVGGDLFDVRRLDATNGLVIVADISGKGIQAAVNTAFVKYSMRTLALAQRDPAAILGDFNRVFLDTISDPNLFVVAFVGVLDSERSTLTYASAGHSGAWRRHGDRVEQLDVTGPIIGLDKQFGYESRTLALVPGDMIVLATDGLTEARDEHGNLLEDAGAAALLRTASPDPQTCADELVAAVRRMSGGTLHDDLALLVIAIDGARDAAVAA